MNTHTINFKVALQEVHAHQKKENRGLPLGKWEFKEYLVQTFIKILSRYKRFLEAAPHGTDEEIKPLRTSLPELAQLRKMTVRSIQHHLEKLATLGLIKKGPKHRWDGTSFTLTIPSRFMGIVDKVDPEAFFSGGSEKNSDLINDPGHDPGYLSKTNEYRGTDVQKGLAAPAPRMPGGSGQTSPGRGASGGRLRAPDSGHQGHDRGHRKQDGEGGRKRQMGGGRFSGPSKSRGAAPRFDPRAKDLAADLLKFAQDKLWPFKHFEDEMMDVARSHVLTYLARLNPEHYDQWMSHFKGMILTTQKYLQRPPHLRRPGSAQERSVPEPWVWFHPDNKHGFRGTFTWYAQNLKKQKSLRGNHALSVAEDAYFRNLQLPTGYATKSEGRTKQQIPPLTLYRQLSDELAKFKRPDLLQKFNEFVWDCTNVDQMPTMINPKSLK